MSANALEKALWQLYLTPADASRYTADTAAYVSEFNLGQGERQALADLDVLGLIGAGANALLVMMAFQTIRGTSQLPEYFRIVNSPA